ncbi:MAG: hyaluronoglucosaminidase [Bermanella sp.]|jgi:hyaluronoglucosaminidase
MSDFALGLIEGFYGRQWSWDQRRDMAEFLSHNGYNHYIYAPKGDSALRSEWCAPFSAQWLKKLREFGGHCRAQGLKWGVGLSPMGLQQHYGAGDRDALKRVLEQINSLDPDVLWLLFDDMRCDHAGLAQNQCAVSADVAAEFNGALAVCPSYYSNDPILDDVFGLRPADYLRELAGGLGAEVDILWTGEKVLSETLGQVDCDAFQEQAGRKPLLWDNYPVNDGLKSSRFLNLNAFTHRSRALRHCSAGHFVNPMNQAELSKLALSSLPALYGVGEFDADALRAQAMDRLPAELARLLTRDWSLFQTQGLDAIESAERQRLSQEYAACNHPATTELRAWLAEEYRFDPDCLTE